MKTGMEVLTSEYDRDIIEAASSDTYFDRANVKDIADRHGVDPKTVRRDIKACRLKEYR
jgi:DeoR/GlpR family transcriptional regulator of sugar metabolism